MSDMTKEERVNKIVDHVWSVYLPIVIAALKGKYPEGREIVAGLSKDDLRRFWEQQTEHLGLPHGELINSVDFFHWHYASFDDTVAADHVDKYIEQWFSCDYKDLMLPKDI